MPSLPPLYILLTAAMLATLVAGLTTFPVIAFLRARKLGQQIRVDGPESHQEKKDTPTMGGVAILAGLIAGTAFTVLLFAPLLPVASRAHDLHLLLLLMLLTIGFTGIGIIDDWSKIHRGRSLGLRAREKLGLQLLLAAGFVAVLLLVLHQDTTVGVPFIGLLQLGWWYWPLAILFVAGMSNAVNLTDGLDGLAAGTSTVTAGALASIAWLAPTGSLYCGQLVAAFAACLGGGCLGFLYHNRPTATVFMGDTGSLAIGAALAGIALALKLEVIFLLAGLIYLIEIGSVMLQVTYFKFTKGRRIFLMSPYHHHLEKRGWSERSIVYRAWVFSLVLAAAAVWLARWTR